MNPKLSPEPRVVEVRHQPHEVGGSQSKEFNLVLIKQVIRSLWTAHAADKEAEVELFAAATAALAGIKPGDEIEGMLAAQMVAAHSASMECYRRAMLEEQTFEGRKDSLSQANKLSRTYTMQMEALNRYRGKGQQRISVEHVHVHPGAQAVVGAIETGGGIASRNQGQPHAKTISYAPVASLWSEDPEREPVPFAGDAERPMSDARRRLTGSAEG